MSARRPLIYLGIFAAMALFYYFYEYKGGEVREERDKQELKALSFSPDSATGFTIVSPDEIGTPDTIRLERGAEGWKLAYPVAANADSATVARLLNSASDAARNRVVEDSAADLSPFGLDNAQLVFIVTPRDGGEPQTLELGNKNPGESYIYARTLDKPRRVVLLNNWLLGDLDKSVYQLRDKRLLEFDRDRIDRLVVHPVTGKRLEVTRRGEGWVMESPLEIRAGADSVDALLKKLADAEAKAFVDTLPARGAMDYGLARPLLTVELRESGSGAIHGLAFGARDSSGNYYASRLGVENNIFMAGQDLFKLLTADPARLRDLHLVGLERDSITTVVYTSRGDNWRAVRDSAKTWSFTEPADSRLDKTDMDNFLWDLRDLVADAFIERPSPAIRLALETPEFTVSVVGTADSCRIAFARVDGDSMYYAAGDGFAGVAVLDSMDAAKLDKGVREMEFRKLVEFESGKVDRVEIERPGGQILELAGGEGNWKVTGPEEKSAEGWKVQNLFWDLTDLEYEKVIAAGGDDDGSWGLSDPQAEIRLWQGDSLVAGVVLGKELDDESGTGLVALRKNGDQRVFAVDTRFLSEIPDSPEDFIASK